MNDKPDLSNLLRHLPFDRYPHTGHLRDLWRYSFDTISCDSLETPSFRFDRLRGHADGDDESDMAAIPPLTSGLRCELCHE